jgi:myo-inositol 2-dehydrogenase/D-chiro-inositol 1-dehydrogenase
MRVAVVGVGRIGRLHAQTLRGLDDVEVLVADAEPGRAAAVAAALGVSATDDAFAARPDALVVAAPTGAHAPLLQRAAQAGLPAFCEKPVALDLATLDAVAAAVERAGTLVQIGFQRRFDAGYRDVRAAVGSLGTLLVLRAATHDPAPPPRAYVATSGGIFPDLNVHDLDAIRFVTGREIEEVYATGSVRETPWFADVDDVDAAAAVLRLEGGALGVLTGTRHDPHGYGVQLDLFGTADSVSVPTEPRHATFVERFGPAYRAELAAFVDAVRHGGPSPCTLADARAALAAALAAERSRREHRPVAVDEVAARESGHQMIPTKGDGER